MSIAIASKTWKGTPKITQSNIFEQRSLILHITYRDNITKEVLMSTQESQENWQILQQIAVSGWQTTYCVYQAIDSRRLQCHRFRR